MWISVRVLRSGWDAAVSGSGLGSGSACCISVGLSEVESDGCWEELSLLLELCSFSFSSN